MTRSPRSDATARRSRRADRPRALHRRRSPCAARTLLDSGAPWSRAMPATRLVALKPHARPGGFRAGVARDHRRSRPGRELGEEPRPEGRRGAGAAARRPGRGQRRGRLEPSRESASATDGTTRAAKPKTGAESEADEDQTMPSGDDEPSEPARRRRSSRLPATSRGLQCLHHRPFDEVVAGRGAVRRRGADPAARLSRPAARQPAERGRAPGQPAAAPAAGPAEPLLDLRPRGRHPRRRAPAPGDRRPHRAALLQGGAGHRVPRHRGLAS